MHPLTLLLWTSLSSSCWAEKILMASMQQPSHVKEMMHIGEALVSRGHEVFIVNDENHPLNKELRKKPGFNVLTYRLPEGFITRYSDQFMNRLHNLVFERQGAIGFAFAKLTTQECLEECEWMMNSTDIKAALANTQFSLAVIDSFTLAPCQMILPAHLRIPFVLTTGSWNYGIATRSPLLASMVPHFMHPAPTDKMTFWSRVLNVILNWVVPVNVFPFVSASDNSLIEQYAPQYSTWQEITEKALLFITTRDHLLEWPAPYMPNVIAVPGLGGTPSKPLTDPELLSIMSCQQGVVLLSFGSTAPMFSNKFLRVLLEGLSQVSQAVIFKYSGSISDNLAMPPNVHHFQKWLPQNDIIGHSNTRAFITHCGNNGQYEALYHGVPMVGIPIYAEQHYNCHRAQVHGYGIDLQGWDKFSADDLAAAVREVIDNPAYSEKTRKASHIMKSEAVHPKQKVAMAIEHVMEFGGDHLRSGTYQLHWTQIWMLDVIAFLLVTLSLLAWLFYWVLSRMWKRVARKFPKPHSKSD